MGSAVRASRIHILDISDPRKPTIKNVIEGEEIYVDFHEQADGARPHEIHLPGGDCTTEIFR